MVCTDVRRSYLYLFSTTCIFVVSAENASFLLSLFGDFLVIPLYQISGHNIGEATHRIEFDAPSISVPHTRLRLHHHDLGQASSKPWSRRAAHNSSIHYSRSTLMSNIAESYHIRFPGGDNYCCQMIHLDLQRGYRLATEWALVTWWESELGLWWAPGWESELGLW